MSRDIRLLVAAPSRTSAGGSAFLERLTEELSSLLDHPVRVLDLPPTRRTVSSATADATHVLCLGTRAVRVGGAVTVFWPLNVAPFERHVLYSRAITLRSQTRNVALRGRLRRSVALADALVFSSQHARSLYMAASSAAATKPYAVIRSGSSTLPMPITHRPVKAEARSILAVSQLYPYKGMLQLIEAMWVINSRLSDTVRLRIAGADSDSVYAARVHARVSDLGLSNRITVASANSEELQQLYADADLVVFPSTCENAGSFALFDGLHAGCPTLCSDRSSIPETVRGAVQLMNPYEVNALGHEILRLLGDQPARGDLQQRALAWSATAPTWRSSAVALVAYLQRLDGHRAA